MKLAAALLAAAILAQDPARDLERKVQQVARKVSDAFVFIGGGSAVLISDDGWFLTNHHVGGTMTKGTTVYLNDGRSFRAELVCTDAVGDLALFKLADVKEKLPFVELGDSDAVECGQIAVAVGNPFGLALPAPDRRRYPSVSTGIISAVHRNQETYSDCLQTDAAVNPGNSGGPLVDLQGRLIGINGRIATRYTNRVNSGVGYAISSNQVKRFLPQMKAGGVGGKIFHGQVNGLGFDPAPSQGEGARLRDVKAGSTADRAGFRAGDVITRVEEYPIFSPKRFGGVIGNWPMGTEIAVTVRREGADVLLKVRLDRYSGADIFGQVAPQGRRKGSAYLGVNLEDAEGGARVDNVVDGSPAEKGGLRKGDLIVSIDGHKVSGREEVLERIRAKKPRDKAALTVVREDEKVELQIVLGRHPDDE